MTEQIDAGRGTELRSIAEDLITFAASRSAQQGDNPDQAIADAMVVLLIAAAKVRIEAEAKKGYLAMTAAKMNMLVALANIYDIEVIATLDRGLKRS